MSVDQSAATASWWDERADDAGRVTCERWAAEFDVIHELVPFGYRTYDPFDIVRAARERLDELPPTAAVLKTGQLMRDSGTQPSVPTGLGYLFRIAGSWPTGRTGSRARHWANPDYVHVLSADWTITDTRERFEEVRRCASIGTFSIIDLAPRFGIGTKGGLSAWFGRHDIPWNEWSQWGRRRIARTAEVIHEWTGRFYHDIADAFGIPRPTLYDYRRHHVDGTDWTVPEDPSADSRFASGYVAPEGDNGD